jgi:hypothetical protein
VALRPEPRFSGAARTLFGYALAMHKPLLRLLSVPRRVLRWLMDGDPHGMAESRRPEDGQHGAVNQGLANNQY